MSELFKHVPRGTDAYGSGEYGASRGNRVHNGVDFAVAVLAPVHGEVTKLGYTYSDDLSYRYVQITDSEGYRVRLFYVRPEVEEGARVHVGDIVGRLQSLQKRYQGITDHLHLECKRPDGSFLSWDEYLTERGSY